VTSPDQTLTDKEAERLNQQAGAVFTPATPITVRELFAGRVSQLQTMLDAVHQPGLHAVLFGERGVGKTSFANVIQAFSAATSMFAACRVNCESADSFTSVWKKALREFTFVVESPGTGFAPEVQKHVKTLGDQFGDQQIDAHALRRAFGNLPVRLLIVFDEFDRLKPAVSRAFTDAIKTLSDYATNATIALVGVADTVDLLIKDHASIARSLVQIPMPRMQANELSEIIRTGSKKLGVIFEPAASGEIVHLSQGLPHYTHLLARNSVRIAAQSRSVVVTEEHVRNAVTTAVNDAQQSIKSKYHDAIQSSHRSALFTEVLLACALAKKNPLSYFQASDVVEPLEAIMRKRYQIAAFARHLNKFCDDERGRVLQRDGEVRRYRYRFTEPLLPPYIIMKGLSSGSITPQVLAELNV
jgi:Cdc6-like AAA superfamily ATPase